MFLHNYFLSYISLMQLVNGLQLIYLFLSSALCTDGPVPAPAILIVTFTSIYASLQSQRRDLSIMVLNFISPPKLYFTFFLVLNLMAYYQFCPVQILSSGTNSLSIYSYIFIYIISIVIKIAALSCWQVYFFMYPCCLQYLSGCIFSWMFRSNL